MYHQCLFSTGSELGWIGCRSINGKGLCKADWPSPPTESPTVSPGYTFQITSNQSFQSIVIVTSAPFGQAWQDADGLRGNVPASFAHLCVYHMPDRSATAPLAVVFPLGEHTRPPWPPRSFNLGSLCTKRIPISSVPVNVSDM